MAPAEIETFILGKGSNQQTVKSVQEFEVGTIQANVGPNTSYTSVKILGNEPHFVIRRRNSTVIASGKIGTNPPQLFLNTGESVEVNDIHNRIKVTDKYTLTR